MLGHVAVLAAGRDIVQHPFVMPHFLLDVLAHGGAQPFQAGGQAGAACHQQRDGVAHMVERLSQEGDIVVAQDAARQRRLDDRDRNKGFALARGLSQ